MKKIIISLLSIVAIGCGQSAEEIAKANELKEKRIKDSILDIQVAKSQHIIDSATAYRATIETRFSLIKSGHNEAEIMAMSNEQVDSTMKYVVDQIVKDKL